MGVISYSHHDIPNSWGKERLKQELRFRLQRQNEMMNRIKELEEVGNEMRGIIKEAAEDLEITGFYGRHADDQDLIRFNKILERK